MNGRALYLPQFGLGNIIQTTPAVRFLQQQGPVTVLYTPQTETAVACIFRDFERAPLERNMNPFKSTHPREFAQGGNVSEVQRNLQHVGSGAPASARSGFCPSDDPGESFDVVFADGWNKRSNLTDWAAKSYPHWHQVADGLPSCTTRASIGLPSEHVAGTIDRTGIGLGKSLGLIQRARVVVCNDTGFFHAACAMGKPTVAVFTFTDTAKNVDPVFHRTARIITTRLDCQPCQLRSPLYWVRARATCGWACRNVHPGNIIDAILEAL